MTNNNEQDELKNEVMKILGRGNVKADIFEAVERAFKAKQEAKPFPIQSEKGNPAPTSCSWEAADIAYSQYRAVYGSDQRLERLAERGGFAPSEMDRFYPGWRNHNKPTAPSSLIAELRELSVDMENTKNCILDPEEWTTYFSGYKKALTAWIPKLQEILSRHESEARVVRADKVGELLTWLDAQPEIINRTILKRMVVSSIGMCKSENIGSEIVLGEGPFTDVRHSVTSDGTYIVDVEACDKKGRLIFVEDKEIK